MEHIKVNNSISFFVSEHQDNPISIMGAIIVTDAHIHQSIEFALTKVHSRLFITAVRGGVPFDKFKLIEEVHDELIKQILYQAATKEANRIANNSKKLHNNN